MASLTPLNRPAHNIVKIDPNPRDSLSDGFNYPSFHLLNKQARVFLSEPQSVNPVYPYRLLAIANIKGWFAAARNDSNGMSIVFSTLQELRSLLKSAKENDENLLVPQRTVRLPAEDVNIITFGMHDARLLVGFTGGQLLVYDTAHLFSAGTNEVAPLNMSKTTSAPFLQILPNLGTEADLSRLVAVARSDGVVQVLDMNKLDVQCGWIGEGDSAPVAISWAPKGKHLAIGLRDGYIITYALSNNATPHKQIPPTADGYLVSLDWISSPLVFKTTYCSKIPESSDATLHIVHADAKSSTGFYYNLMHPFPAADRNKMHALTLSIPKWDEDVGTQHENSSGLVIIGDMSSVDLEVLAHKGAQWFQQSQENPLQLPLDKSMNDTILASLEADLTDSETGVPIMYAYLNDGTLQGWKLDHPKSYIGMISLESGSGSDGVIIAQETVALAPALSPPATLGQTVGSSTFGQPSTSPFAPQQPPSSHFGQQPTFGQPSFGSAQTSYNTTSPFGNIPKTTGAFGSPPSTPSTSAFGGFGTSGGIGQTQPSFSTDSTALNSQSFATPITREASMSDETSLGGLSLGGDQTEPKSGGIFDSFITPTNSTPTTSGFDGIVKPATGFGAFNNYQSQQSTTPTSNDVSKSTFGVAGSASAATSPGQPVFGQSGFAKPSFGQSSFGQPSFGQPGFSTATTTGTGGFSSFASNGPSAFATPSKPATTTGGFGAFASSTPTAFGAATTTPVSEPPKTPPFATPSGAFSASFGGAQTSFKPSAIRDSPPSSPEPMSVVKAPLPVDDDMSPPGSPVKRGATPMSTTPAHPPPTNAFSNLSAPLRPASGFGAFGGVSTDSPFFKKAETTPATPSALLAKQPASTTPAVPPPVPAAPKFGATSMPSVKSAFAPATSSTTPAKSPQSGGFGAFSGSVTGFSSFAGSGKSFTELLKASDKGEVAQKDKEKAEYPKETVLETPKKEEQSVMAETPKTPFFTPPSKAVTMTPISELPTRMTEKEIEPKKETPTEKKLISSEESFVKISKEEGEITDEEGSGKGTKEEQNEAYSSGSLGPSDSEGSIDGTEDEEEELEEVPLNETTEKAQCAGSVDAASIPLPLSRSPSAPPEVPSIQITPAPEATAKQAPPLRELSSTPPETTTKTPISVFSKAAPSTTPTSQPFNIGLGRPSTRPARSSPLAGVPVTVNDQDEGPKENKDSELPKPKITPSPKTPFKELPVKTESAEEVKAIPPRPRTPPLLTATPSTIKANLVAPDTIEKTSSAPAALPFLFQKPEPVKPSSAPSSTFGGTGFFGDATAKDGVPGQTPASEPTAPATGVFKAPFTTKADTGTTPSNGLFGTLLARPVSTPMTFSPSMPTSSETNRPASVPPSNFFGKTPPKIAPTFASNSFSIKRASGDAPSIFSKPVVTAPADPPAPTETPLEEGMQKECALLYNTMNQELQELRQLAQGANKKRQELEKSRGGSRRKTDLGDAPKWGLVDIAQFGQLMRQFGPELLEMRELRVELKQKIRQIETKMLKAGTRKEEIARFTKAQNDKEFAKMLKTRTLGPEHLETQTQLRRSMRIIRDRIQKLEEHLQASKKKLAEADSGKPSFKVPTLDTVNRTYRNIELAIQYQTEEIADLSERIGKLKVSTPRKALLPSQRDPRLPDNELRRPFNVTPHIAVTTAAALNAERSSAKLKKALLAARKQPLLNDKAARAPAARITFKTPTKMGAFSIGPSPNLALKNSGSLFPAEAPQTSVPDWSFPEDDFNPSPSPPTRRGASRTKMHSSNAPLRKSGGPSQPPPATFDWGPLPAFNPQPPIGVMSTPVKSTPPTNPPRFVSFAQFKR